MEKRRRNDDELAVEATAEGNSGELARVNINTFYHKMFVWTWIRRCFPCIVLLPFNWNLFFFGLKTVEKYLNPSESNKLVKG